MSNHNLGSGKVYSAEPKEKIRTEPFLLEIDEYDFETLQSNLAVFGLKILPLVGTDDDLYVLEGDKP